MTSLLFFDLRIFLLDFSVDEDNVHVYVEIFLTVINDFQPLITNTKRSILDFASVLHPSLNAIERL